MINNVSENKRTVRQRRHDSSVVPFLERIEPTMLRLLWFSAVATGIVTSQMDFAYDECRTSACDGVAKKLNENINYKIHPCENFRKYACRSIDDSEGSRRSFMNGFNSLNTMENNDADYFREILENRLAGEEKMRSLEIEREIFARCIKFGLRNADDKEKYENNLPEKAKILEHLNHQQQMGSEHWNPSDMDYATLGYGHAFFNLKIYEQDPDSSKTRGRYIKISPPTDNVMEIRSLFAQKYDNNNKSSYQSASSRELKKFLNELNRITQQHGSRAEKGTLNSDQLITIENWKLKWIENSRGQISSKIEWEKVFNNLVRGDTTIRLSNQTEIIVVDENYFTELITLLDDTPVNTIENYVNLRYISKTIGLVDSNYLEYSLIPSINKLTCTPGLFVGTAYAYAKKYFGKDNRQKLREVFKEVRDKIISHLDKDNYLSPDNPTKAFLQKLSEARVMYGYPDWLLNENVVANLYPERMTVNDKYFNNEEILYSSVLKHNAKAYRNYQLPIIDIDDLFKAFTLDRIEIFEKNTNEIVIPIRVFSEANFPFFSALLFDPMNYASVGTLLATEIYQKWLSTITNTNNVTDCMKNHLPTDITQKNTDPFKTRATAYLLGLRTAYEAWPNKDSYPIMFPRFGAIHDSRLFFLSFAETLCDRKQSDQMNAFDTRIIPADFINAVLSNMKEFQKTFVCDDNHTMNKKTKCDPLKEENNMLE